MCRKRTVAIVVFLSALSFSYVLMYYWTTVRTKPKTRIGEFTLEELPVANETAPPAGGGASCESEQRPYVVTQRGHFFVLNNYVRAELDFMSNESVTLTTHSDFTYLGNVENLVKRWDGPISIALHAPGTDFGKALESILYLRRCGHRLVKQRVTFHVYFEDVHVPSGIPKPEELSRIVVSCEAGPPYVVPKERTYKHRKKVAYPVNVGRNVARQNAATHFVLASDIELFPSPGLVRKFMRFVDGLVGNNTNPRVYVLPVFEVRSAMKLPMNRTELVSMIKNGSAQVFHKIICPSCHRIPLYNSWLMNPEMKDSLSVFHVAKRVGSLSSWEPIFIGTNDEPFYDERMSWESKRDKMSQSYVMCVRDYEFHVLDNAFLTHKPGIKTVEKNYAKEYLARKTYAKLYSDIHPQFKKIFGTREGCKF